jgi:hypothetical protein
MASLMRMLSGAKAKPEAKKEPEEAARAPKVAVPAPIATAAGISLSPYSIEHICKSIVEATSETDSTKAAGSDAKRSAPTIRKLVARGLIDIAARLRVTYKEDVIAVQPLVETALKAALSVNHAGIFSPVLIRLLSDAIITLFSCGDARGVSSFVTSTLLPRISKDVLLATRQ